MKKLVDIILEIGDASARPYDYKQLAGREDTGEYLFKTDSGVSYRVSIDRTGKIGDLKGYEIGFAATADEEDLETRKRYSYNLSVDRGEMYRVMATITDIVTQFFLANRKTLAFFIWSATDSRKNSGAMKGGVSKEKLYRAFITRSPLMRHFNLGKVGNLGGNANGSVLINKDYEEEVREWGQKLGYTYGEL